MTTTEIKLNLTRPLAFIDLETTGVNVASDRIVEISVLKVLPDHTQEVFTRRVNPTISIPPGASKIHGIMDEDVKDAPKFSQIAGELIRFISNSDFAGYNSTRFDIPLLAEEFLRAEIDFDLKGRKFIDVQNIFHKMEQRTLSAAYKFYCDKEIVNAHSAEADIKATYEVLMAQLNKYQDLQNNIDHLHEFSSKSNNVDLAGRIVYNEKGQEVFNFGKHKDKPVTDVFRIEPSYFDWMMKGDFPLYTKKVLTAIRLRDFNSK
jgi:DNA polymerase III subunit epsilon